MEQGVCIVVFGVSGVGKTASCEEFIRRHTDYLYFSASALLQEATSASAEALRTASPTEIQSNQDLLGPLLSSRRAGCESRPVLIDAHAVIWNDQTLVSIPASTIRQLSPDGLVLLRAPASVIVERRRSGTRRRPSRSQQEIGDEDEAELAGAREYAAVLGVPLEIACVSDPFVLDDVIAALRRRIGS